MQARLLLSVAIAVAATLPDPLTSFEAFVDQDSSSLVLDLVQWAHSAVNDPNAIVSVDSAFDYVATHDKHALTCVDESLVRHNRYTLEHMKAIETSPHHAASNLHNMGLQMNFAPDSECLADSAVHTLARGVATELIVLCDDETLLHTVGRGSSSHAIDASTFEVVASQAEASVHFLNGSVRLGFGGVAQANQANKESTVARTGFWRLLSPTYLMQCLLPADTAPVRVRLDAQSSLHAKRTYFHAVRSHMKRCKTHNLVVRGVVGGGWATIEHETTQVQGYAVAFELKYHNKTNTANRRNATKSHHNDSITISSGLHRWAKAVATAHFDMGRTCDGTETLCFQTLAIDRDGVPAGVLGQWKNVTDHAYMAVYGGAMLFALVFLAALPAIASSHRRREGYTSIADPRRTFDSDSSSPSDDENDAYC
ncbi:Aste57867_17309 [Aphanomyces stellatus]|uniref:Aste57867_17309 protein n=1 Tax=Aphanomyces stellatus TaxID=120398 RepID=A0A485L8T1_9STRA|nr:hypothetical protein As57867_017250 [Aphanomyces stellatus]VFT94065.1 Aste57867_17309 [Aphanomyces stellatus]